MGIKLLESGEHGSSVFRLTFHLYDNYTRGDTNEYLGKWLEAEKDEMDGTYVDQKLDRFLQDQIVGRSMVRDMGFGIDLLEISFENSVIVTQRFDEYLLTMDDF